MRGAVAAGAQGGRDRVRPGCTAQGTGFFFVPGAFALSGTLRYANQLVTGMNLTGAVVADVVDGVPVTAAGTPLRTVSSTDVFQFRMRVQREF